jgi:urea ABC transporter ATP-binding protein UrtE
MLLETKDLAVHYGQSYVCQGVSVKVDQGEEVCLLGRNGVGKTTLLKCIMSLVPTTGGSVFFEGTDITRLRPHEVARLGIGYVPQGRMIFPNLTVAENLRLGTKARKSKSRSIPEIVFQYFPRLKERMKQLGGSLSGGEQQMLAIGRALASLPKLVLMDEPSEGLSAGATLELIGILKRLCKETDLAIFLVEQNLDMALETATKGYVMEKGCIVAQGSVSELQRDEVVKSHLVV